MKNKIIILTGGSGFVGSHLVLALLKAGYRVRATTRRFNSVPFQKEGLVWFEHQMPLKIDSKIFATSPQEEITGLIHSSYDVKSRPKDAYELNLTGSESLLYSSRKYGVPRFIFISSLAAHPEAESFYGRGKLAIEQALNLQTDLIIRPGLVIGSGGLFLQLAKTLKKSRVVPLFFGGVQQTQTIGIDDLCQGIVKALELNLTGRLTLACPNPISFRSLFRAIAKSQGVSPLFLHLPASLVLLILKCTEFLGISLPLSSDNILGLKKMISVPTRHESELLSLQFELTEESINHYAQTLSKHL